MAWVWSREAYVFTCGSDLHTSSPTFLPNCDSSEVQGYIVHSSVWAEPGFCKYNFRSLVAPSDSLVPSLALSYNCHRLPGHVPSLFAQAGICLCITQLPMHCHYPGGLLCWHAWATQPCSLPPWFFSLLVASPPSDLIHPLLWLHPGLGQFLELLHLRSHKIHTSHSLTTTFLSFQFCHSLALNFLVLWLIYLLLCPTLSTALVFPLIPICIDSTAHLFNNSLNFNVIALLSFCHTHITNGSCRIPIICSICAPTWQLKFSRGQIHSSL